MSEFIKVYLWKSFIRFNFENFPDLVILDLIDRVLIALKKSYFKRRKEVKFIDTQIVSQIDLAFKRKKSIALNGSKFTSMGGY